MKKGKLRIQLESILGPRDAWYKASLTETGNMQIARDVVDNYDSVLDRVLYVINEHIKDIIGKDEDIDEVHKFFKPRMKPMKVLGSRREIPPYTTAYDFAGGNILGRNLLRAEQRKKAEL